MTVDLAYDNRLRCALVSASSLMEGNGLHCPCGPSGALRLGLTTFLDGNSGSLRDAIDGGSGRESAPRSPVSSSTNGRLISGLRSWLSS